MDEVQEAGNYGNPGIQRDSPGEHVFCQLVESGQKADEANKWSCSRDFQSGHLKFLYHAEFAGFFLRQIDPASKIHSTGGQI
jgi:hypothetical protein